MIRHLLRTNVVSEPVKPEPSEAVLSRLRERSGEVALPPIAWHELIYGARRMDEGRRRDYLLEYLREVGLGCRPCPVARPRPGGTAGPARRWSEAGGPRVSPTGRSQGSRPRRT
jgi:hypothetical protein